MKILALSALGAAAVLAAQVASATIISVPGDQPTIQDAVDAAAPGDEILVHPGTYPEKVSVPKKLAGLHITGVTSFPFLDRPELVCPGHGDDGFRVKAPDVAISGLRIVGCNNGVRLDHAPRGSATNLVIDLPRTGVNVRNSPGSRVADTFVGSADGAQGILAAYAPDLVLENNTVVDSYREGIRVQNSPRAALVGNDVTHARGSDGIRLDRIAGGVVRGNTVTASYNDGIRLANSAGVTVENNGSTDNGHYGIRVDKSPPIKTVADLTNAGNTASGNPAGDFKVRP